MWMRKLLERNLVYLIDLRILPFSPVYCSDIGAHAVQESMTLLKEFWLFSYKTNKNNNKKQFSQSAEISVEIGILVSHLYIVCFLLLRGSCLPVAAVKSLQSYNSWGFSCFRSEGSNSIGLREQRSSSGSSGSYEIMGTLSVSLLLFPLPCAASLRQGTNVDTRSSRLSLSSLTRS